MAGSRAALEELLGKYVRMRAMRVAHADGTEDAAGVPAQMAALADRFPGALREIDRLPLDVIEARVAALEATLGGRSPAAPWMVAMVAYHAGLRGALSAKRWLGGRKVVTAVDVAAFRDAAPGLAHPEDALAWADRLHVVAAPPGGRLVGVVVERVAGELGVGEGSVRRSVGEGEGAGESEGEGEGVGG